MINKLINKYSFEGLGKNHYLGEKKKRDLK